MFKIYGTPQCTYCNQAKQLLAQHELSYEYLEIGKDVTKELLQLEVPVIIRTVPQIFYGDTYIGGYKEMLDYIVDNDLV